jgi:hypothetical protein
MIQFQIHVWSPLPRARHDQLPCNSGRKSFAVVEIVNTGMAHSARSKLGLVLAQALEHLVGCDRKTHDACPAGAVNRVGNRSQSARDQAFTRLLGAEWPFWFHAADFTTLDRWRLEGCRQAMSQEARVEDQPIANDQIHGECLASTQACGHSLSDKLVALVRWCR